MLLTLGDKKVTFSYDIFLKVSNELLGIKTKIFKCFRTVIFTTYIFLYTLTYEYFPGGLTLELDAFRKNADLIKTGQIDDKTG